MANRYWVGGTGTWNTTNTSNWSDASGGSPGATVPSSSDNVFFDGGSDVAGAAFVVTVSGIVNCADFLISGLDAAMTISGDNSQKINCYGSYTLTSTNLTYSGTFGLNFYGTGNHTIDWAGKNANNPVIIQTATGSYTLASHYVATNWLGSFTLKQGTFSTANYNITVSSFFCQDFLTRTLNLGSSTVTVDQSINSGYFYIRGGNLTFDAGTSKLRVINSAAIIDFGDYTVYDVEVQATNAGISNWSYFYSGFSCRNLTITSTLSAYDVATTGVLFYTATYNVSGTFTAQGISQRNRLTIKRNINADSGMAIINAAAVSLSDVNFCGIEATGAAAPFTGTRLGNSGNGNTGITFDSARTVYWRAPGLGTSASNASTCPFSLTSGGAASTSAYPLPQDTVVVDNNTEATSLNIGNSVFEVAGLDFSNRTTAISWNPSGNVLFGGTNGALKFSSAVSPNSAGTYYVSTTDEFSIDAAGVTLGGYWYQQQYQYLASPVPKMKLLSDFTFGTATTLNPFIQHAGRIDCNGHKLKTFYYKVDQSTQAVYKRCELYTNGGSFVVGARSTSEIQITLTYAKDFMSQAGAFVDIDGGDGSQNLQIYTQDTYSYGINNINGFVHFRVLSTSKLARLTFYTGYFGHLDASAVSQSPALAMALGNDWFYGDLKLSSAVAVDASTSAISFKGSESAVFSATGTTLDLPATFNKTGAGKVVLGSSVTFASSRLLTLTSGEVDLAGYTLSGGSAKIDGTTARTIRFNGGTWVVGGSSFDANPNTALTIADRTTGTFKATYTTSTITWDLGAAFTNWPTFDFATAQTVNVTASAGQTIYNLKNSSDSPKVYFTAGRTYTFDNFELKGSSGNLARVDSQTAATHTLSKSSGTVSSDYLNVRYSTATGGATWYAGANSVNISNNSGWLFSAAPVTLTGNNVAQPATSTSGVVSGAQVNLTGNSVQGVHATTSGAVSQTHALSGNSLAQTNTAASGAVSQGHSLVGSAAKQTNTSTSGEATQTHVLAGNAVAQQSTTTSGSVAVTHNLSANPVAQKSTSGSGAITQTHKLTGNAVAQKSTSAAGAITQTQTLTGNAVAQRNTSWARAIGAGITTTKYFVSSVSGTVTTPANALNAPDNTWTADGNTANSWTHRWRLGDPSPGGNWSFVDSPITFRLKKGTNTGTPSVTAIRVYQNSTLVGTLFSGTLNITSTTGSDHSYTIPASWLTTANSSLIDVEIATSAASGGGTVRNSVQVDAATWSAQYLVTRNDPVGASVAQVNTSTKGSITLAGATLSGNSVKQINTSTTGAIAQTNKLAANSVAQANKSTSGAVTTTETVTGNSAKQVNTTTTGAISVTHALAANSAKQVNTANAGAISQTHKSAANAVAQINTATSQAIAQTHRLTAGNVAQINTSNAQPVSQTHELAASSVAQINAATTGAIGQASSITGNSAAQRNASTTGSVSQTHGLSGASAAQVNTSTAQAVSQVHALTGSSADQVNESTAHAVAQVHQLSAASVAQLNTANSESISQAQMLAANSVAQRNASTAEAISQAHALSGAHAAQINTATAQGITQTQILAGADVAQANLSTSAPVSVNQTVAGNPVAQVNTTTSSAISQTHALLAADSLQPNTSTVQGVQQVQTLEAQSVAQANSSSAEAITQAHALAASNSAQENTATSQAVSQIHALTSDPAAQVNTSSTGEISQDYGLAGVDVAQTNLATASAVSQIHRLEAASVLQVNNATNGSVSQSGDLLGENSVQTNQSTTGEISQTHRLAAEGAAGVATSSTGAVTQVQTLVADDALQDNQSTDAAISQTHIIAATNAAQNNTATAAPVTQDQSLAAVDAAQVNTTDSGAVSQDHLLAGASVAQINTANASAISQTHEINAASVVQTSNSTTGSVSQSGDLLAENVEQSNLTTVGTVSQIHRIDGASLHQTNNSTTGPVSQSGDFTGANVAQVNTSTSDRITQVHEITGSTTVQQAHTTSASVTQTHRLTAGASVQKNVAPGGVITQVHALSGQDVAQNNKDISGAVNQTVTPAGADVVQVNTTDSKPVGVTITLSAQPVAQGNRSTEDAIAQIHKLLGLDIEQRNAAESGFIVIDGAVTGLDVAQANTSNAASVEVFVVADAPFGAGYPPEQLNFKRPESANTMRPPRVSTQRRTNARTF